MIGEKIINIIRTLNDKKRDDEDETVWGAYALKGWNTRETKRDN